MDGLDSVWLNQFYFSFDTVPLAMLNQFEMASTEGWTLVRRGPPTLIPSNGAVAFESIPFAPSRFDAVGRMCARTVVHVQVFMAARNIAGKGLQPYPEANPAAVIYFIPFIMVGWMFLPKVTR